MTPQQRACVKPRVFVAPVVNPYEPSIGNIASYSCLYFVGAAAYDHIDGDVDLSPHWVNHLKTKKNLNIFVKTGTLSYRSTSKRNSFCLRTAELKASIAKYSDANPEASGIDKCSRVVAQTLLDNRNYQCVMMMVPLWEYTSKITTFEIENRVRHKFVEGYLNLEVTNAQENFVTSQERNVWGSFSNNFNVNFNRDSVLPN